MGTMYAVEKKIARRQLKHGEVPRALGKVVKQLRCRGGLAQRLKAGNQRAASPLRLLGT
jgi:hypothetical protein